MQQQQTGPRNRLSEVGRLGGQVQALAQQMAAQEHISRQQVDDLQALVAELTDAANALEQHVQP